MEAYRFVEIGRGDSGFGSISLPSSKSVGNRALIINALQGGECKLSNIPEARDSQLMMNLLKQPGSDFDAMDAGTTMRFLTAYLSIQNKSSSIHGTERMHERPIGILVEALNSIGANITYQQKEGYPPLAIGPFRGQLDSKISIRGDVSSQYISALMMIAPSLPQGLEITITGKIGSWPYIRMTAGLMEHFGVRPEIAENVITIKPGSYSANALKIEPDWSAASYWYSIVALSGKGMLLRDVGNVSFQGDRRIVEIMRDLGVNSTFTDLGLELTPNQNSLHAEFDFTDTPDLAQTVAVTCAAKGITCRMTGLESLRIKETDRIAALQNELKKIGAQLIEDGNTWTLIPANLPLTGRLEFDTYEDHRMAMAFAPLASLTDIRIKDPKVVRKSYPSFWEHLESAGFTISFS